VLIKFTWRDNRVASGESWRGREGSTRIVLRRGIVMRESFLWNMVQKGGQLLLRNGIVMRNIIHIENEVNFVVHCSSVTRENEDN
jgi:hypothetical protein